LPSWPLTNRLPLTSAHGDHLCNTLRLLPPVRNPLLFCCRRLLLATLLLPVHQGKIHHALPPFQASLSPSPLMISCSPYSRSEQRISGAARSLRLRSRTLHPLRTQLLGRPLEPRPRLCWAFLRTPGLRVSLGWGSWRQDTSLISSSLALRRSVPSVAVAVATSSKVITPRSSVISCCLC
jgi:hypothetical protein